MKFNAGDAVDNDHCTALQHEFLRCQDAFTDFERSAGAMILQGENRLLAYKTYNAYSRFIHHLYEFLLGTRARDIGDTAQLRKDEAERYILGETQRILTRTRKAIEGGTAPSWENDISYYPTEVPKEFATEFRQHRNKAFGHVTYQRAKLSMSEFYNKNHKSVAPARIPEVKLQETKPKRKLVRTPYAIAGVLLLLFIVYGYNASQRANSNPSANPIERLVKQQHTTTLANPALSVNALGYSYFKLVVPSGATSVLLHGTFTASGGTGNDIEAFVLPENDYVNWQNGHNAKTFYNSGKVTVGTLNVNLPADAGTYYLVFNNKFSLLSQKTVRVDAALTYYQ